MQRNAQTYFFVFAIATGSLFQTNLQAQPAKPIQAMVGEVIIVGNKYRHDDEIRRYINLFPGQVLSYPELKVAEDALLRSGLFKVDSLTGAGPTVQVLESPGQFKDILIKVEDLPPTLFEETFCPSLLAALLIIMTLLAARAVWRRCRQDKAD